MKGILAPLVLAILLLAAGVVLWTLGRAEEQIARVKMEVAAMEYSAVADGADETDRSLAYASRVPGLGGEVTKQIEDGRATADYWQARYDALALERDAGGALVEHDPQLLLLAANAAYRASRLGAGDRGTTLDRLDAVVSNYADVLKSVEASNAASDALIDAAYNYELAARMRSVLERARPGVQLPANAPGPPPSIHGRAGGPPKSADMNKFMIVIPKRSDERDNNPEGGQGQRRIRKG